MQFTVNFLGRDRAFDVRDLRSVRIHIIRALYEERLSANGGRVRKSLTETAQHLGMAYNTVKSAVRQRATTPTR